MLEKSIQSLRNVVDYVNVVYQDVSWTGKQGDGDLLGVLQDLKTFGLIDEILKFEPDLTATAVEKGRNKKQYRRSGPFARTFGLRGRKVLLPDTYPYASYVACPQRFV